LQPGRTAHRLPKIAAARALGGRGMSAPVVARREALKSASYRHPQFYACALFAVPQSRSTRSPPQILTTHLPYAYRRRALSQPRPRSPRPPDQSRTDQSGSPRVGKISATPPKSLVRRRDRSDLSLFSPRWCGFAVAQFGQRNDPGLRTAEIVASLNRRNTKWILVSRSPRRRIRGRP
jgi:hypothetical protein